MPLNDHWLYYMLTPIERMQLVQALGFTSESVAYRLNATSEDFDRWIDLGRCEATEAIDDEIRESLDAINNLSELYAKEISEFTDVNDSGMYTSLVFSRDQDLKNYKPLIGNYIHYAEVHSRILFGLKQALLLSGIDVLLLIEFEENEYLKWHRKNAPQLEERSDQAIDAWTQHKSQELLSPVH